LLTEVVSVHAGRQLGVADTAHVPSADSERASDLGPTEARCVARDFARGSGDGSSPPLDTDLSVFPITPPVDPACAKATCWFAAKTPNSKIEPIRRPIIPFTGNPPILLTEAPGT
jgi:hypothetical protein